MATPHLFRTYSPDREVTSARLGVSRRRLARLAHLSAMDAETHRETQPERRRLQAMEGVVSLTELCEHLHVSAQTIYDLRSQGRGPRGFRVGRELRFRISEIDAWLTRLESDDNRRDAVGGN